MQRPRLSRQRGAAVIAGLLAVAVLAGGAGIAAAGSGAPKPDPTAAGTQADKQAQAGKPNTTGKGVAPDLLAATQQALDGLVADGTISQSQADAVQTRVASGSIDPAEIVAAGVLDEAQMQIVNQKLVAVKMSFAGP